MCEIQYMKTMEGTIAEEDFKSFCEMMTEGSYCNADAWGICNDKKLLKKGEAFYEVNDYDKLYKKLCNNKKFLIGHNRFATQGDKKVNHNNHPFESKNYFLVHNGVITNDKEMQQTKELFYKGDTDSIVILEYIQALKDLGVSTYKAIKKTCELLKGSFSVFVYDKNSKKTYYFKNSKTSFHFALIKHNDKELLFGSTNVSNFEVLYNKKKQIFDYSDVSSVLLKEAESGVIYEITNTIKQVGTFKEAKEEEVKFVSSYDSGRFNGQGGYDIYYDGKEIQEMLSKEGIRTTLRIDYKDSRVMFIPSKKLSSQEDVSLYTMLANMVYYDDTERAYVMTEDDASEFLLQYGTQPRQDIYKYEDER